MQARTTMLERTATSQGLKVYVPVLRYLLTCIVAQLPFGWHMFWPLPCNQQMVWITTCGIPHTAYMVCSCLFVISILCSCEIEEEKACQESRGRPLCCIDTPRVFYLRYTTIHHESNQQISNVDTCISLTKVGSLAGLAIRPGRCSLLGTEMLL